MPAMPGMTGMPGMEVTATPMPSMAGGAQAGTDMAAIAAQMQAMMQGNAAPAGKQRVSVTEQLKLNLAVSDKAKDEELMEHAINGMLSSLDPYSIYLPPRNFQEARVQTRVVTAIEMRAASPP